MTVVSTTCGKLKGAEERGAIAFKGIPFAAPPVGALRWGRPQPPAPWDGVRDALEFGPASFQAAPAAAGAIAQMDVGPQSEDCLYLNVWTPAADGGKRPVMVWIHGGAFVIGAGSQQLYNGARLAARGDVVVVSINYRLGIFGFLRGAGPGPSTGNEGILDQIAALRWVRAEIAAFGGDPDNVTVFGESAGSISTACVLTAPEARGLYHKAILESGSLNLTNTREAADETLATILQAAKLDTSSAAKLMELSSEEVCALQGQATPRGGGLPYAPVADGDVLPADLYGSVASGESATVPIVIGSNLHESKLFRFMDPEVETLDDAGLSARAIASLPGGERDAARAIETYRATLDARGEPSTATNTWLAMQTDSMFRAGAMRHAELHSRHAPAYAYLFTWETPLMAGILGAAHALELPFVFGNFDDPGLGLLVGEATPETEGLSGKMQDAWIAFARTGNPATESLPAWPRYEPGARATMEFNLEPRVLEAPMEAERAFWG